jgi:hypothetical protein
MTEVFKDNYENKITIFDPRGVKDYLREYPDLSEIKEFKELKSITLLKFVWWVSNPTSPIVDITSPEYIEDFSERIGYAYDLVINDKSESQRNSWKDGELEPKLKDAIKRMSKISPNTRDRAREMVNDAFNEFEKIIKQGKNSFLDKNGTPDYKKYVDSVRGIVENLEYLIKVKEEGFGISKATIDGKEMTEGQNNIARFLKSFKE